jgi:hypothetical protein
MAIEIVTLAISILALAVSVLVFIDSRNKTKILKEQNEDNRKKTEIMENQLKLLQAQSESKQDIREAVKILEDIQERITKLNTIKYDWGDFGSIAPQRFLEMLHDSGTQSITWDVRPYAIFGKTVGDKGVLPSDAKTFDTFKVLFETLVPKSDTDFVISFISEPGIDLDEEHEIDEILVKDYVKDIYSLKSILDELKKVEKVVNMYNCTLLSDIQEVYHRILRCLFGIMGKSYKLEINPKTKARELPNHLLSFTCLGTWQDCVKDLKEKHNLRLFEITRRMRESM